MSNHIALAALINTCNRGLVDLNNIVMLEQDALNKLHNNKLSEPQLLAIFSLVHTLIDELHTLRDALVIENETPVQYRSQRQQAFLDACKNKGSKHPRYKSDISTEEIVRVYRENNNKITNSMLEYFNSSGRHMTYVGLRDRLIKCGAWVHR